MIVITTGKKKVLVICLAGAWSLLWPEKKSSSRLLGPARSNYDRKKKDTVICPLLRRSKYDRKKKKIWRVRDRYYDRKKKRSSRLSGGCMIVITTGKKKVLVICWAQPVPITTGKKKIQSSVRCYAVPNTTGKKNKNLAGARSLLWPEKKVLVVCLAGAWSLLRPEKKSSSRLLGPARSNYDRKKKRYSRLSVVTPFQIRPEKKTKIWRVRDRYYNR